MNSSLSVQAQGMPLPPDATGAPKQTSLIELMYDGMYLLFMLRNRIAPVDASSFREKIKIFLGEFERNARRLSASADDIFDVKYAFCAAVDEAILSSHFSLRDEWERQPLQLTLFGEQLAGEQFFVKLEELRAQGARRVQALEVFYHCLLHGFRGKYLLEGPEKINYLIARVGDEVAHYKGRRAAFAPHWAIPDRVRHVLRSEVPIWVIASIMGVMAMAGFFGLRYYLNNQTHAMLAGYEDLFKPVPQSAHINITWP